MRRVWTILIIVAVCLVVAAVVLVLSLDGIARTAIESQAGAALGTRVAVTNVHIGVVNGSAEIKGLEIANPAGYPAANLLELGRAKVALRIGSLLGDTVQVKEITLEAPVLHLAQQGLKTNLQAVLDNAAGAGGESEKKPAAKAGKKFKIDRISISGAKFEYKIGSVPSVLVPLPDVELKNITNADGSPVMIKDVIVQVLAAMAKSAAGAAADLPGDVKGALEGAGKIGAEGVKKAVEGVGGVVKGIGSVFKKEDAKGSK